MAQRMIPLDLALSPQLAEQRRRELELAEQRRRQLSSSTTGVRDDEERKMMQMLEQMQQARAPNRIIAAANTPQAFAQQKSFQQGMQGAMQPKPSVSGGSTTAKPEDLGFFSRLGRNALDALQDPVQNAQIVTALNSMRFDPDPLLAKAVQTRAVGVQESRQRGATANRTVEHLKRIGKTNLANLVDANPAMASEALSLAYQVGGVSDKFFAPKTDPTTGAEYVTRVDPNTGEVEIVMTGGKQLTPEQKFRLEQTVKTEAADFNQAQKVGVEAMKSYDQMQQDIGNLEQALAAVRSRPGITGPLAQYLPNITAESAAFERAANQLGLGVVSGTTFGALSASELDLALRTNIDKGLPAEEQIKQLENIIRLRRKMSEAMYRKARELASGEVKYSTYIESQRPASPATTSASAVAPPPPVTGTPPPLSSSASSYLD